MKMTSNKVKAYLKISKNSNLILGLFLTPEQIEKYILQEGVQPKGIMTICVIKTKGG
jgi:hypothetical protein